MYFIGQHVLLTFFALASGYLYNGRKIMLTLVSGVFLIVLSIIELVLGLAYKNSLTPTSITFVFMVISSMFYGVFNTLISIGTIIDMSKIDLLKNKRKSTAFLFFVQAVFRDITVHIIVIPFINLMP